MAKQMVYFNATKQIDTVTIHYNEKLDGAFVQDVANTLKDIAQKMRRVDLKNPREFEAIQVYVYPSKKLFYRVFGEEIEKRFYRRKRSLEDMYVVQDAEGNIHIVSPRGMGQEKTDAFKKILVMKILGEYMEEREKQSAERLLKESMKPKAQEVEEPEELEEEEVEPEEEEQQVDEDEIEEQDEEELDEEELDEIIATELVLEQIDEEQEEQDEEEIEEEKDQEESKENKENTRTEAQEWLSAGWLAYVNGKLKKADDVKRFASNISKNGVKKLGQLSNAKIFENYNYSVEYACALVAFVVETYGMEKFTEFYKNPKDIKGVFGIPKFAFDNAFKAFVYSRYSAKEMKMEIDQREMKEVTEIHFAKSGGVDITSDKEIDAPEVKIKE